MPRPTLHKVLKKQAKGGGGRPLFDYVLMFKILVLERIYNLSDDQTEFQINDRADSAYWGKVVAVSFPKMCLT